MRLFILIILILLCPYVTFGQDPYLESYSLGLDLMKEHQYVSAIEEFDKAYNAAPAKSQERSKALWGKGMAYYGMAQNQNLQQNYEDAYRHYGEAMKCFRRVQRDKDVMDCAKSMAIINSGHFGFNDLALEQLDYAFVLAMKLGLAEKQIEILDEKMSIFSDIHDETRKTAISVRIDSIYAVHPNLQVDGLIKKGDMARSNGDIEIALSYYHKAEKTNTVEKNDYFIFGKLRDTYSAKKDYENALKYSNKCVSLWMKKFEGDKDNKYLIFSNHSHIQMKVGDMAGALSSLDSIQKYVMAGGSKLEMAQLLLDKGFIYSHMKEYGKALSYLSRSDSILSSLSPNAAILDKLKMVIPMYAAVLYQNKDYQESKKQYLRHIKLVEESYGKKSREYAQVLLNLANIEGFLGELDNGARHYIESWNIARDITCQDLQMLPSNARGKYWNDVNDLMWHMTPYALKAEYQEDAFTSAAYEALVMSKGMLLSLDKSTGQLIKESGDKRLLSDFMAVANIRNEIEQQRSLQNGSEVMRLYTKMDSLDRILTVNMRELGISPTISYTTTSDIIGCLKEKEALIDFTDFTKYDGSHIYAAFIVRKDLKAPRLIKVFEQSRLDSLISDNNGRLTDIYSDRNAGRLRDILIKPLIPELDGIETIYYVPSGIMHQLAVEAIPLPDEGYFGDKYEIVRLSNSKELLSADSKKNISEFDTARLYGGLEYDVTPSDMVAAASEYPLSDLFVIRGGTEDLVAQKGFDKLRKSSQEVIEIADILIQRDINVTPLMNNLGTEESFVSMSGNSPDLLLVSTHGFYYSPENIPAWSSLNGYDNSMYLTGLVLSGGNAEYLGKEIPEGVMGGLLTSSDISGLDLRGTQLVVLSACETARGEITNEGVYGLQRAFKQAGAQTLVMSLWPVSDLATTEFMTIFHKEMAANGWSKRDSFKKAKTLLREKYNNPYYWAAFIMVD